MLCVIQNKCLLNKIILPFKYKDLPAQVRHFFSHLRRRKFGNYKLVKPEVVSEKNLDLPNNISTPSYYENLIPQKSPSSPEIKTLDQIKGMRESCRIARAILTTLETNSMLKVGTTTDNLDKFVHNLIISKGAYPSPLNYNGFPKSICTSINNIICHGIPDSRPLQDGDIINVDVSVFYKGFHGDCSAMFLIGNVDDKGKHLVRATLEALNAAIAVCKPGQPFSIIGSTVEKIARKHNLRVVPEYAGHGIGAYFHGPPDIFHYENNVPGKMAPGMTFTIEPIMSQGSPKMAILDDKWTSVTLDGSRTAQWEHTLLVTNTGVEILTSPNYTVHEKVIAL